MQNYTARRASVSRPHKGTLLGLLVTCTGTLGATMMSANTQDTNGGPRADLVILNAAIWTGAQRTYQITAATLYGLSQLITAKIGVENLAGPIGIGEIAADSFAEEGWFSFLWIMCVISVNLAILNLLPIPILDGGQIVLAAAEGIKGSPLPIRAREIAQTVGLSLILLLMGFAFWNDLARNWAGIVGFFKGLV